MDRAGVVAELSRLRRVDRGMASSYRDAAERVADERIRGDLRRMEAEHRGRAQDIESLMRRQGTAPVETSLGPEELPDALTRVSEAGGTAGVIAALELAERSAGDAYAEALRLDLDPDSRRLVERGAETEQGHLRFLESHPGVSGGWGRRGTEVRWGTSGYGTGDQFGGGESEGAGGFSSAGPSYSGGEDDVNTGE